MSTESSVAMVLGFPGNQAPAQGMAQAAGLAYADVEVHHFPDGESRVRLPERLPPQVICFSSLDHPNPKLVELVLAAGAAPELGAERLSARRGAPLLIGPDAESEQWVSAIAAAACLEYGVARKERLGDREVRVALPDLDLSGREVVLVDDVISTGQTLVKTAQQLVANGVESITALVTHALFADDALRRLEAAGVGKVISTDSVAHESNGIALATLLASAWARVAGDRR